MQEALFFKEFPSATVDDTATLFAYQEALEALAVHSTQSHGAEVVVGNAFLFEKIPNLWVNVESE